MQQRPLSPHLSVYRWLMTNTLSILHRITGVALSVGSLLFVAWLWAAAYNEIFFEDLHGFFSSILGRLMLLGWTAAFYYHLCNGIRHLIWDAGKCLEIHAAVRAGKIVLAAAALLTAFTWFMVLRQSGFFC